MRIAKYLNKNKIGGLILIIVIIIAFGFGGFGGGFISNNQNNIAKINKTNITSEDFINFINQSGISQQAIRENLNNDIIEELLSNMISTKLLDLEIEDFGILISKNTLLKKIKENKNFIDENGIFQRIKYEKFLLENNIPASIFESRLKKRELQKNLFDYIGSGTVAPKFLMIKNFEDENKKLILDFINLDKFYKNDNDFTNQDLENFINDNEEELKIEYIDFKYSVLNPKNLFGIDEFNQAFFDKVDEIENSILNGIDFNALISKLKLEVKNIDNFRYTDNSKEIEKKIFQVKDNNYDIFEDGEDFIIYNITNIEKKRPDISDNQIKKDILRLIKQNNKFAYNKNLLDKIRNKKFGKNEFVNLGGSNIETITLNSIKDNKKFSIESVQMLYSLPVNSFTLINDENNKIYLTQIKNYKNIDIDMKSDKFKSYVSKDNSNNRNHILKSYDIFLSKKYNVIINQASVDRVKNFFQ